MVWVTVFETAVPVTSILLPDKKTLRFIIIQMVLFQLSIIVMAATGLLYYFADVDYVEINVN